MFLEPVEEVEEMPETSTVTNVKMMGRLVDQHSREIDANREAIEDHAIQIKVQAEQIKQLQDNALRLENVVMSESRDTRLTITQTNNELHHLIKDLLGYNSGRNELSHSLRMARMESIAKIVGILAGSGGILYYVFG